jgi:FAD/FMN-containing dehydrogenase
MFGKKTRRANSSSSARQATETGLLSYTQEQLAAFQAQIAGSVTQPGTANYNDDRMVFMHTYQHYPQLIVFCSVISDVVAALKFACEIGLKVVVRSGGHSTAGYSVNDQFVIDMSQINHVLIDKPAQRARVGAGANFRQLNMMLNMTGLHVPGGGCESVCVAGYMQGGGYGFSSRLFGMNCDSVIGVTMALASGEIVHASATANQDLFWAVRGGTGNQFGVLLEIEYKLHPLGDLFGFGLRWMMTSPEMIDKAVRAVTAWQHGYTSGPPQEKPTPEKMGHQALIMYLPTSPDDPTQKPQFLVRGLFNGSEAKCLEALTPLIELMDDPDLLKDPRKGIKANDPLKQIEIWETGNYMHLDEILLLTVDPPGQDLPTVSMNTKPLVDSRIVADMLSEAQWRSVIDLFLEAPDKTDFLAMEAYGGAINAVPATDTAFVHRNASIDLFTWVFWTFDAHEADARAWLEKYGEVVGTLSNGHRYQNYPLRGNTGFRREYFGENFDRLLKVKREYDPDNLFSYEQSITAP